MSAIKDENRCQGLEQDTPDERPTRRHHDWALEEYCLIFRKPEGSANATADAH